MLNTPDQNAAGFVVPSPDPLRYEHHTDDPDEVAGILASMIPYGARVLDVGCGTGSLSKIIASICGAEIVGVEPDERRASAARQRGLNVHAAFLNESLLAKLGTFQVVVFADVLE